MQCVQRKFPFFTRTDKQYGGELSHRHAQISSIPLSFYNNNEVLNYEYIRGDVRCQTMEHVCKCHCRQHDGYVVIGDRWHRMGLRHPSSSYFVITTQDLSENSSCEGTLLIIRVIDYWLISCRGEIKRVSRTGRYKHNT